LAAIDSVACAWIAGIALACVYAWPVGIAFAFALPLIGSACYWRRAWPSVTALGLVWGAVAVSDVESQRLPSCADGVVAIVDGRVVGLPESDASAARFEFDIDAPIRVPRCGALSAARLRLTWFGAPPIDTGEGWQLEVRLRALRNYRNPGGFDYLAWASEHGIDGAGTVRRGVRTAPQAPSLDAVRAAIGGRLDAVGGHHSALYRALTIGDGGRLGSATWAQFRATGTIHVLVISGLHISIAAGFGALVGMGLWRATPISLRGTADHYPAIVAGIVTATMYAALAGFGLPVQRAWLMSMAALLWWGIGRELGLVRLMLVVVALVLGLTPRALLDSSLWLSVAAVAVLLGYFAPRRGVRRCSGLLRAQVAMFVGLLPVLVAGVGQFSWVAPLANLFAVPLVSLVLVPIMLVALPCLWLAPGIATSLYRVAEVAADILFGWLAELTVVGGAQALTAGSALATIVALATAGAILLPIGLIARALLCFGLVTWFSSDRQPVAFGAARVTMLDVGQGLAMIVDTAHERLLYDAGPRFPSGFDLGETAVVPALRATGEARLDLMMISHADSDHAGGADAVRRLVRVRAVLAGEAESAAGCRRGDAWQWSGVLFRVLAPDARTDGNAASCVLHIQARDGAALLPGDIDASSERRLLVNRIGADLLVAPHHGSRSSSSQAFLDAVAPAVIAVSAGHRNRFGHPHPDVLARYAAVASTIFVTAQDGALRWDSGRPNVAQSAFETVDD